MENDCPFCLILGNDENDRIINQNEHAFSMEDGFPVSPGHTLIISKRHVGSFFDVTSQERNSLLELLDAAQSENEHQADAYNIGINDGSAAGQTVPHLHIHLIPRHEGDVKDPRGGVRWVVPKKASYWGES